MTITLTQYFMMEEPSDLRHEYLDGEIFAMAGGTPNHNRISGYENPTDYFGGFTAT